MTGVKIDETALLSQFIDAVGDELIEVKSEMGLEDEVGLMFDIQCPKRNRTFRIAISVDPTENVEEETIMEDIHQLDLFHHVGNDTEH